MFGRILSTIILLLLVCLRVNAQLQVTITGSNATCAANASVQVHTQNGVAPLNFVLLNSSNAVVRPGQADSLFSNLAPGTYKAAVYDAVNNVTPVTSSTVTVTSSYQAMSINSASPSSTLSYSCTANANAGSISLSFTGGTPPFTASITSGPAIPAPVVSSSRNIMIGGLSSGNYVASLTDSCGNTVATNTLSVNGTAPVYPTNILSLMSGSIFSSNAPVCGPRYFLSFVNGAGALRWYMEYPTGSGFFTDTVTSGTLYGLPYVNPATLIGKNYTVYVQHPCTGVWQSQTLPLPSTIPMSPGLDPFSSFYITTNCDSVVPRVEPNYNTPSAFYCYPIRITVADTNTPAVFLADTTLTGSGYLFGKSYVVPGSGVYWVTLTDAQGSIYRQPVTVNAQAPLKLSNNTSSFQLTSCDLTTGKISLYNVAPGAANFPVTFNLISLPGGASTAGFAPFVLNSSPAVNQFNDLWQNIPGNISGNAVVEGVFSCRRDTVVIPIKKFTYTQAKFDSTALSIGSAGCSANKANVSLYLHLVDTSGVRTNLVPPSTSFYPFAYRILPAGASTNLNGNSLVINNLSPGTYKIGLGPNSVSQFNFTTSNPSTCPYWDTLTVVVPNFGAPVIDANRTYGIVCSGDSLGKLTVFANGYPPFQYRIKKDTAATYGTYQSNNLFTGLSAGNYSVQVQDGCNAVTTQTVSVQTAGNAAFINVTGANNNFVHVNSAATLNFVATGAYSNVVWTKPDSTTVTGSTTLNIPSFQLTDTGIYTVTALSALGCTLMASVHLMISGILPLKLLSFDGQAKLGVNMIAWTTTNEVNSDHFDLEYADDAQHFNKIARVNCSTAPSVVHAYNYAHSPVSGTAWYRLKMIDRDASYTYSNILVLKNDGLCAEDNFIVESTAPIPFDDHVTVRYCAGSDMVVDARIVNVQGKCSI